MRTVAGRDTAALPSVDIRRQADSDDGRGLRLGDDAIRADAGRSERGFAAIERADLFLSAPNADAASERVQAMRRRSGHVDGHSRRGLEVLEPKILAIDGAAHTGPHLLFFDDEVFASSRREIHSLKRALDIDVA